MTACLQIPVLVATIIDEMIRFPVYVATKTTGNVPTEMG